MNFVRWNELLFLIIDRIKDAAKPKQFMPDGVGANSENIRIHSVRAIQNTEDALDASNGSPCVMVSWLGNGNNIGDYDPITDCSRVTQFVGVYCMVDAASNTDTAFADTLAGYLSSAVIGVLNGWDCVPTGSPPRTKSPFNTLKLHSEQRTVYPSGSKKTLCYYFVFQASVSVDAVTSKL